MWKKVLLSGFLVFVMWSVLDFIIHGVILKDSYEATAQLWRPMSEMKMGVMYMTVLISALAFASIYGWLIRRKGLGTGVKYGLLYGIGMGIGMGYGTYSVMPIPYHMALIWFLGTFVEVTLGGCLLALIIRE